MNSNVTTKENKNNNNNSTETKAITATSSNAIPMNNNNETAFSNTMTAAADVTSSITATASAALTPIITVVEAAVGASNAANNSASTLPVPAKNVTNKSTMNDSETQNMRLILPVFIQNERKYSQPERQRKIQSSPVKSMRRFSQDSSEILDKYLNVSQSIKAIIE